VLIVGTGALGSYFAARLSADGISVTMLGTWAEGLETLRREGVCLVEQDPCQQVFRVRATDQPSECTGVKYALVLVKSWQTERAARQLSEILPPNGLALTLQNGLGNWETLAQTLGEERAALGVTTLGANLLAPGRVRPAGDGPVTLGEHPRLAPLAELLRRAGFSVELTSDPRSLLWGKLVINAAVNPLTALLGMPNGGVVENPAAREILQKLVCETAAVAEAQGIRLPYPDPVAAVEAVARRTASNRSSMLRDIQRGAPTEIDAICGAIVQAGEQLGVPAPVNWTMWKLVKAISEQRLAISD
jgi:2-dehydropantoate 2-reductase